MLYINIIFMVLILWWD